MPRALRGTSAYRLELLSLRVYVVYVRVLRRIRARIFVWWDDVYNPVSDID